MRPVFQTSAKIAPFVNSASHPNILRSSTEGSWEAAFRNAVHNASLSAATSDIAAADLTAGDGALPTERNN